MTNVKITGPSGLKIPSVLGGDDLGSIDVKQGIATKGIGGGNVETRGWKRTGFTLNEVRRMVNAGAEVENFEVWFELVDADTLDEVHPLSPAPPDELTWSEYGVVGESHAPVGPFTNGHYYRSSCIGSSGVHIAASIWIDWTLGPNSWGEVITVEEYLALRDAQP